jgi:hypothetical protein
VLQCSSVTQLLLWLFMILLQSAKLLLLLLLHPLEML